MRYAMSRPQAYLLYEWQWINGPRTIGIMTDSDWATCPRTRKSKSGGAVWVGGHCVHHWCRTQDRIARSSGEVELKSACKGMNEGLGLLHLANFLLPAETWRLELSVDASAAIGMVHRQGPVTSST